MNYYNEYEPYAAAWLRNLIDAGHLPAGVVDTRSIVDVQPDDLVGFKQCHFFAGIGGWPLAARLAGWPDDRELWTGSCPCQPFSTAGLGLGHADERHLWPHQLRLIRARRPAVWMGEQVAAAVGKDWLDGVFTDLEGVRYAGRAVVVPACAVNAPHRRDRLWIVADALGERWPGSAARGESAGQLEPGGLCGRRALADAEHGRRHGWDATRPHGWPGAALSPGQDGARDGALADGHGGGWEPGHTAATRAGYGDTVAATGCPGHWDGAITIVGHDGKARRVEPGIRLLAHGVSGRVAVVRPGIEGDAENPEALHWYNRIGALKAFGNAIVPEVAAEVIGAYMECRP